MDISLGGVGESKANLALDCAGQNRMILEKKKRKVKFTPLSEDK